MPIRFRESDYKYSDPIIVRNWPTGSISVSVGYVRQHPENNRIILRKTWIGRQGQENEQQFNVKDGTDWLAIKAAVDRLLPQLAGSESAEAIHVAIERVTRETDLLELIVQYPELLTQIPADLNILALPTQHKDALKKLLAAGGEIANSVITRLSREPIRDLEQFAGILEELKLSTVNALVTHVTGRLSFIDVFEHAIRDDASYERRGKDSIHALLRANIWIVDRNYSVLHDDETLKNILAAEWGKIGNDRDGLSKRPDFLCMVDRLSERDNQKKLVIIEIKRPSVTITLRHVDQAMEYRATLERYSGRPIDEFVCYIVGREVDGKLTRNSLTASGFVVKTYDDFIRGARGFYEEYLAIIRTEDLAF
jgi:hypothetical protein